MKNKYFGPQQVGGTYLCGYWNKAYKVLGFVNEGKWNEGITIQWLVDGKIVTHLTPWDKRNDKVLSNATEGGI